MYKCKPYLECNGVWTRSSRRSAIVHARDLDAVGGSSGLANFVIQLPAVARISALQRPPSSASVLSRCVILHHSAPIPHLRPSDSPVCTS